MFKEEEDFKNQHNHDGIFGGSHATTSTTAIAASARTNFVQPVDHALAGSLSSMFVFALLYPLDVARTRQQSSTYRKKKKVEQTVSVYQSVLNIYKEEGVNGLYSGFSTNVISIGTSQCLYFFFHELIKDSFINIRRISLFQNLFVAFIAGCINATVTCPMWVAATRLKLKQNSKSGQGGGSHENNRPTFASSLVNVIVSGDAWRGLSPSLILCTNPAIQYGIYEQLKTRLLVWWSNNNNKRIVGSGILNPMPALLIGAISKSIATIFTYPLQLIQTRTREIGFNGGMYESMILLMAENQWDVTKYFIGMKSKLIMTVLNASLMFMFKENVLLHVIKFKKSVGVKKFRLLRWITFIIIMLHASIQLLHFGQIENVHKPSKGRRK